MCKIVHTSMSTPVTALPGRVPVFLVDEEGSGTAGHVLMAQVCEVIDGGLASREGRR